MSFSPSNLFWLDAFSCVCSLRTAWGSQKRSFRIWRCHRWRREVGFAGICGFFLWTWNSRFSLAPRQPLVDLTVFIIHCITSELTKFESSQVFTKFFEFLFNFLKKKITTKCHPMIFIGHIVSKMKNKSKITTLSWIFHKGQNVGPQMKSQPSSKVFGSVLNNLLTNCPSNYLIKGYSYQSCALVPWLMTCWAVVLKWEIRVWFWPVLISFHSNLWNGVIVCIK